MERSGFFVLLLSSLALGDAFDVSNRIVGGHKINAGEAGYQLSIQDSSNRHLCGATLAEAQGIQFAVSAAHCFRYGPEATFLLAGALDLSNKSGSEQNRQISQVVVHELFENDASSPMANDIALLFFKDSFILNDNVTVAQLATPEMKDAVVEIKVTGWGDLQLGGPASTQLQGLKLPLVDDFTCQLAWNQQQQIVVPSMMCAQGFLDRSPCNGDSGGPAVLEDDTDDKNAYLLGVVSFGKYCGHPEYPAVFTEVAYFNQWITEQVLKYKFATVAGM